MRVLFSAEVLDHPNAWGFLDEIVSMIAEGRHIWVIDDIDSVLSSPWIKSEPESRATRRNLETLEKAATDRAYREGENFTYPGARPSRCHTVELRVGGAGGLEVTDAVRALREPARLIVENEHGDGIFIRAIIHAYRRDDLSEALGSRWLVLDHAGGKGEIGKRVKALLSLYPGPTRVQVLADSDSLSPDHVSETTRRLEAIGIEHNITVQILRKREIENYLPLAALADNCRGTRRRRVLTAYLTLTQAQQDHYDMKDGFSVDAGGAPRVLKEQEALFETVNSRRRQALVGGFGSGSIEWLDEDKRGKLPYYVNRQEFESRCANHPGELESILAMVEEIV